MSPEDTAWSPEDTACDSRVLITGGAGFIGSAVLAALGPFQSLRLMAHRREFRAPPVAEVVHGDLTDPSTLVGCCADIDVLIHLASAVGQNGKLCWDVNLGGTQNLLTEAARAGVREVIYVSTAAVHGRGPHHELSESAPPAPISAASLSKRRAEEAVLAAGGIVLRPFFTYGDGDRWFVPTLLRWLRSRVWIDRGNALQSVVAVEDLAAVVAAAARHPRSFGGSPFHVCEPYAIRTGDILLALASLYRLPKPMISLPSSLTLGTVRMCRLYRLERRLELFSREHTYQSARVWEAAGCKPGPRMLDRLDKYASWYETFM